MLGGLFKAYSGKKYGNCVADFLGIHRGLYHNAMEEGGCEMHLLKLHFLKKENLDISEVAYNSSEYILPGLLSIEARFGKQDLISDAVAKVKKFVGDYELSSKQGTDQKEKRQLMEGFREGSAISCWILITYIERKYESLDSHPELLNSTKELLAKGQGYAEMGNYRVAYIHFSHAIREIIKLDASISKDEELVSGIKRLNLLEKTVINPLWEKHKGSLETR